MRAAVRFVLRFCHTGTLTRTDSQHRENEKKLPGGWELSPQPGPAPHTSAAPFGRGLSPRHMKMLSVWRSMFWIVDIGGTIGEP